MSWQKPKNAYFRGQIVPFEQATLSIMNQTFNYGTGVFGGIRAYWNDDDEQLYMFRPLDHFKRFLNSSKLLRFEFDQTPEELAEIGMDLMRLEGYRQNVYLRPLAFIDADYVGVRLRGEGLKYGITMFTTPFGSYVPNEEGTHVTISSWRRVDDNAIPARGKITGAYVNSALIKTDAESAGFDEAIVLNEDGHISEGSAENFFLVRDGIVYTPPIYANLLEGITRRTVIQLMREDLGIQVVERNIDRTEIYIADEAFFCGTGVQIAAITRVDHRPIGDGSIGPIVTELRDLYFDVVSGKVDKYKHWNHPIYVEEAVK